MNLKALRIVGLEGITHIIQLRMFPSIIEVRTSTYYMILTNMYGFVY